MRPPWQDVQESQVDAIDRRSIDGIYVWGHFVNTERFVQRHGMSDSRPFTVGSDDPHFAQAAQGFREDCQPGGKYSVIVCDQNQR